ncbi:MAG: hypothetical protein CVU92_01240 [Firmicutes bacterium HGW-Firmicutes-17]|jgi:hypothetical protein|nr:MAG: hypothetical protein CVU92_01240 [Firmicutes bacterium HGW-Firmicutes-17]
MKLIINGNIKVFKNSVNEIEHVLEAIQQVLVHENLGLSHLIIDGVAVYQNYGPYLSEQIDSITEIEVITLKLKPLIEETLGTSFDYIKNAVGLLKPLAESYYQSPGQDAWTQLADLFEGIGWLLDTMTRIDQIEQLDLYLANYDIWNEYVRAMKNLNNQIKELEQAMTNRDNVLIGDLILYEILPVFETAEEKLRFLVPSGGQHVS